jgi:hypothetical protein
MNGKPELDIYRRISFSISFAANSRNEFVEWKMPENQKDVPRALRKLRQSLRVMLLATNSGVIIPFTKSSVGVVPFFANRPIFSNAAQAFDSNIADAAQGSSSMTWPV